MLYSIAGLTVEMDVSGRTARQGAAYAAPCGAIPDFTVETDIRRVMEFNSWIRDEDEAEYMGTGTSFAVRLLDFGGLQLHACCVELGGRAYLFSGPCGVGKSTMGGRWTCLFGASYINDDKPALRLLDGRWYAFGTPWSGKTDLNAPVSAPVGGIAFMARGERDEITPQTPSDAIPKLLSQTPAVLNRRRTERLLELLDSLSQDVPIWLLKCTNSDEAAQVALSHMTEEKVI